MISLQRLSLTVATLILLILLTLIVGYSAPSIPQTGLEYLQASIGSKALGGSSASGTITRGFHYLLPATASNANLCRLLLSSTILGYPEPVLIGWGGHGEYNGTESHLFKISETLAYLNSLPPSMDEDLVLELDAYDIWLQLRPEVLISRYYRAIEEADKRLEREGILGKEIRGEKVRQTVLFGPDKICWPSSWDRAPCWAVPESSLDEKAFGPVTDHAGGEYFRPRWLNSGTIMGPVKEIRAVFNVTMALVRKIYDEKWEFHNSDQYYFAEIWGDQEIMRMALRDREVKAPWDGEIPAIAENVRTEYGIVLDHKSIIFQTAALYSEFLTWMALNRSTPVPSSPFTTGQTRRRIDQITLPDDVAASEPPFAAALPEDKLPTEKGWSDLKLGTNTITEGVFPLFHMTGDKSIRASWWPKMWFFPYGEKLLNVARRKKLATTEAQPFAVAEGVEWVGAKYDHPAIARKMETRAEQEGKAAKDNLKIAVTREQGVVWSDQGEYLSWDGLCSRFHEELFEERLS